MNIFSRVDSLAIRKQFDNVSTCYDDLPISANSYDITIDLPRVASRHFAIDVGCGTGSSVLQLSNFFSHVIGVDSSYGMISVAKQKNSSNFSEKVNFFVGDIESLPFCSNKFDFVFSHTVLHHCNDLQKTFFELKRLVRPNGVLVVIDIVKECFTGHFPPVSMLLLYMFFFLKNSFRSQGSACRPFVNSFWMDHQRSERFYKSFYVAEIASALLPGCAIDYFYSELFLTKFIKIIWVFK